MKKPLSNYTPTYPIKNKTNYYADCETNNTSCNQCNSGDNSSGSGNGSGNSGSVSGWN